MKTFQFLIALAAIVSSAVAGERYDPFTRELLWPDLVFGVDLPTLDQPHRSELLQPSGQGPFPAIVVMPTCKGAIPTEWVDALVAENFVVLAVDPLTPREIKTGNCESPLPVPQSRLMKDAVDGGHFLQTLAFVDGKHIGLIGFSQGGQLSQSLTGGLYKAKYEPVPFAAMAAISSSCGENATQVAQRSYPVDIRYEPDLVTIPLLIQSGENDQGICPEEVENQKAQGAPIEYRVYSHAPHMWMDMDRYRSQAGEALKDTVQFLKQRLVAAQ